MTKVLSAIPMHLRDGEQWDDKLTGTLTREQWQMAHMSVAVHFEAISDELRDLAIDDLRSKGRGLNPVSAIIGTAMLDSAKGMMACLDAIAPIIGVERDDDDGNEFSKVLRHFMDTHADDDTPDKA